MLTVGIPEGTAYNNTFNAAAVRTIVTRGSEGAVGVYNDSGIIERMKEGHRANQSYNYIHQHSIHTNK